jgi:hypothetical protein
VRKGLAYCGLVCADCPAYQATQAGDHEALRDLAKEWSAHTEDPLAPDDCICDGCLALEGRHISHWGSCTIRMCATKQNVENCGWCEQYPCELLEQFLVGLPHAKANLESVHRTI